MGIWSCLGKSLDEVRDSLYTGKSGIIFDPARKEMGFRSALTAKLEQPDLKGLVARNQRVYMPEQAKYAYMATVEAMRNAKLDPEYIEFWSIAVGRSVSFV
jgi:3-oxoacyl-[acyl-carrier-protein] synthase-1